MTDHLEVIERLRAALSPKIAVVEEVGRGGMGAVFLGRDLRHDRYVAIKVLHPHCAGSIANERFLLEIRTAAQLLHPNILHLYDSGEADGLPYYVMPYVKGESLAARIERDHRLPLEDALQIGHEVADALVYAHRSGIIHRDIKPANVLLADGGHVCVADFGLALAIHRAANHRVTATGVALGSPPYMSPEQINGDQIVDGKADVYSLACMLFEVLSGEPPFSGPTVETVLLRHLSEAPRALRTVRADIPHAVEEAVARALAKDPQRRPDAAAFRQMLMVSARAEPDSTLTRRLSSGDRLKRPLPGPKPPRVLVLPFTELSAPAEHGSISMGLTDEIIASLSGIEALRVISRASALQLRGTTKSIRALGEELNVQFVVEGSVQRTGDTVRIYAHVDRAEDEHTLWAKSFDGPLAALFEIEESIARAVSDALKVRLTDREKARLAERPIPDIRAYEYYLRAKQQVFTFTAEALDRAVEYLKCGTRLVGDENVQLIAAMGYVYWQYYNAGISPDPSYLEKARGCGERLFELDPGSADGHRLIGLVSMHQHQGDLRESMHHLKAVLATNPDDTDALFWLVLLHGFVGRCSAGYPLMERLIELDPLTPLHQILPGFLAALDGDLEEACPLLLAAHQADPGNPVVTCFFAQVLAMAGRKAEPAEVFAQLIREHPGTFFASLSNVYLKALEGSRHGMLEAVTAEVRDACAGDLQYSWSLAECFAMVGESDQAIEWLANSTKLGLANYPLLARHDPLLRSLHGLERYLDLLAGVRKQWITIDR